MGTYDIIWYLKPIYLGVNKQIKSVFSWWGMFKLDLYRL
ncbi:hypothetical protein PLUTE_b0740 [Pseudoalteromonas luteoviolacea DSM 6061]|nr:hypothetical protein [Pseudoalteromonas luteoviolacea DSM 6061]